jgi:hypothetical protein
MPAIENSRRTVATFLLVIAAGLGALFLWWYAGTVRELDRTAVTASQARTRAMNEALSAKKKGRAAPVMAVPGFTGGPVEEGGRAVAPTAQQLGNISVSILAAEIRTISINRRQTTTKYLVLTSRVTNLGKQNLAYLGWHHSGAQVVLRDKNQNYYNHIKFVMNQLPDGCIQDVQIRPNETITDLLVFEAPPPGPSPLMPTVAAALELDLPLGRDLFRLTIPPRMVKLVDDRPQPVQQVQTPPPPSPLPPPPQVPLEQVVAQDHDARMAQAMRAAQAKSSSKAKEYLRARKQEIISELAERYGLTRTQVKAIVRP